MVASARKRRALRRAYREKHKEELSVKKREYYYANAEALKATAKAYYQANAEARKATARAYYQANAEARKAAAKANYQANAEARKATAKAYYQANAEKMRSARLSKKRKMEHEMGLIDETITRRGRKGSSSISTCPPSVSRAQPEQTSSYTCTSESLSTCTADNKTSEVNTDPTPSFTINHSSSSLLPKDSGSSSSRSQNTCMSVCSCAVLKLSPIIKLRHSNGQHKMLIRSYGNHKSMNPSDGNFVPLAQCLSSSSLGASPLPVSILPFTSSHCSLSLTDGVRVELPGSELSPHNYTRPTSDQPALDHTPLNSTSCLLDRLVTDTGDCIGVSSQMIITSRIRPIVIKRLTCRGVVSKRKHL